MSSPAKANLLTRERTFAKQAELVLREMILDGTIGPSERLNEVALAAQLGISRGPLREAMQRLATAGLLTIVSHRGAFVRTFSRREVIELYEVRGALEVRAVRIVGERASDEELDEVESLLRETESRMSSEEGRPYPAELDFHMQLVAMTGNEALLATYTDVNNQLSLARSMSARRGARAQAAVAEHHELLEMLKRRDIADALELVNRHLEHSRDSALNALGMPEEAATEQL